jgi:hypothetical protein
VNTVATRGYRNSVRRKSKSNKLEETEGIQYMEFLYTVSTYKISNNALPNIQNSPTE